MASSRVTSNGPDWQDVAKTARELERELGVVITIECGLRLATSPAHIVWIARAYASEEKRAAAEHLASASVSMLTRGGGGTDSALLLLLYELDRDIYRNKHLVIPQF